MFHQAKERERGIVYIVCCIHPVFSVVYIFSKYQLNVMFSHRFSTTIMVLIPTISFTYRNVIHDQHDYGNNC